MADTPEIPAIDISKIVDLLLGPVGLTVGALFVILQFASDKWLTAKRSDADRTKVEEMWRDRYDEMKTDRDTAIDIAEKAVGGYTSVADAIKERNRLDTLRLRNLQAGLPDPTEQPNEAPDPPGVTAEIRRTEQRLRTRRKA
jgi:hypothetical protein